MNHDCNFKLNYEFPIGTEKRYRDIMSLSEAAEYLNVSTKLTSRLIHEGKIFAVKVGREYRIAKSSVKRLVGGQQNQNCVLNVTSNPQIWTYKDNCGIVCVNKNQQEVS